MNTIKRLVLHLSLWALSVSANADLVILRSGTIYEGNVHEFDNEELILDVESGTTILKKKEIASIHFDRTVKEYKAKQSKRLSLQTIQSSEEVIAFGQEMKTDKLSLTITSARIAKPKVKDMFGDMREGENLNLLVAFRILNTMDRKILRYQKSSIFERENFSLRDDAYNEIRPVSYGWGYIVIGALTGTEDINPNKEAKHIVVFSIPPEKTKYLILSVNLKAFGEQGIINFKIPVKQIEGFAPRDINHDTD